MQFFNFILIVLLLMVLVSIAFFIVIQRKSEDEETVASIHQSGAFSLIRESPREKLLKIKASRQDILDQLVRTRPDMSLEQRESLADQWEASIEKSIQTIEEGDKVGAQTYGFKLSERDLEICKNFITGDSYVSREQIYKFPELLPPYYIGCTVELINKQAWENPSQGGWKPLLPVAGKYSIPEWQTLG